MCSNGETDELRGMLRRVRVKQRQHEVIGKLVKCSLTVELEAQQGQEMEKVTFETLLRSLAIELRREIGEQLRRLWCSRGSLLHFKVKRH